MLSLIEPTYRSYFMISPIAPIYKTSSRKKTNQNEYLENRKPKIFFKDVLDQEISMGLGTKISVRI